MFGARRRTADNNFYMGTQNQSMLRPPEVHTRYVHFNVNARFVLRLWGLMVCMPRTWWQK